MKKIIVQAVIVLTTVLVSSVHVWAQERNEHERDAQQKFVDMAINANRFEIAMGQLAAERSDNEAIKRFGQMLADDHTTAAQELERLLVDRQLTAPKSMSDAYQSLQDAMEERTGAEFNTAFKEVMIKSHEDAISFYEIAANGLQDKELSEWARNKIPVLREHLEQARQLNVETARP